MEYIEIFLALFSFLLIFFYSFHDKNGLLTDWPLVGMLPAILKNHHRIHDYFVEIGAKTNLSFLTKGPWFTNMINLGTIDPANVHHVFSRNFQNYPKGSKFKEIFEVLGDGIFNTDSDLWLYHRKMAQSFLSNPRFLKFFETKIREKVETGLVPVLDHASKTGLEIDLQDLFERFTFDSICTVIMGHDPRTLSIEFPSIASSKALNDIEEGIFYRHVVPTCVWKLLRWLGVGPERKYRQGWEILDDFIYGCLSKKREEKACTNEITGVDLITLYMDDGVTYNNDKFLRDTFLNFLIAGRDTTSVALSWFFYLLSRNPRVLSKIKEELAHADPDIYLHAALCEALRLYPPVPLESKVPIESDILPSGHKVDPNTQIVFGLYAMGRIESIWGKDCLEFRPERWISEKGKLRHEPSYKFMAFNAGPRSCVGKNMAFTQMKVVAVAILSNYNIEAVEGQTVVPDVSIILRMKNGFKVKIGGSH